MTSSAAHTLIVLIALTLVTFISSAPQFPTPPNYSSILRIPTLPLPPTYSVNITQRIRDDGRTKWRFDVFVGEEAPVAATPKFSIHLVRLTNETLPQTGTFALLQPGGMPMDVSLCYILPMDFGSMASLDLLADFHNLGVSFKGQDGAENVWSIAFGTGEIRTTAQEPVVPTRASIMNAIELQWDNFREADYDLKYFAYDYSKCLAIDSMPALKVNDWRGLLVEMPLYVLRTM